MTDEVRAAARRAWAAMVRQPSPLDALTGAAAMPVWAAVDMVQDVTDDRGGAVRALIETAADDLEAAIPGTTPTDLRLRAHADAACSYLRWCSPGEAAAHAEIIRTACAFPDPRGGNSLAVEAFRQWAKRATAVVALCRDLENLLPKETTT